MDRSSVLLKKFSTKCTLGKILVMSHLIAVVPQLQAQQDSCDSSLKPEAGKHGYSLRTADDRCEGLYISPVGGGLQIVSLFRGKLNLHPDKNIIHVSASDFKELLTSSIRVRAVAIPQESPYR